MKINPGHWEMFLRGIDTEPSQVVIEKGTTIFTIGLKLLAVEYLLGDSIKDVLNEGRNISNDFCQFEESNMSSLENFSNRATKKIKSISTENIDSWKKKLFELIYASNGSMHVKELSQQFGISLKAYCNILRLGASFKHISEGKLFPEQNFTDQNHFIKEIKKYAGVTPKELSKNKDDRFIDITAIKNFPS
ncbi:MAG TPA: hypothetical protein VMU83_20555 [Hanamia sp.]|nr:hypothetical protein [Hanamia sp.]